MINLIIFLIFGHYNITDEFSITALTIDETNSQITMNYDLSF